MADNAQKTWLPLSLNRLAQKRAVEAIQQTGKALPASVAAVSGSIVTVKFELSNPPFTLPNVTVPLFGPEWIRYPTQVGDKGMVIPADARLGGMSGLGDVVADLSIAANLSALVFMPIGNAKWTASENPNALVLYGPDGVIIRDMLSKTVVTVATDGVTIVLQAGDQVEITGDVVVTGNISATGTIIAGEGTGDQVGLQTHRHLGVTTGGGSTLLPTLGT